MNNLYIILIAAISLGGCSAATTIQKASLSKSSFDDAVFEGENHLIDDSVSDKDAYRIFHQASTGFTSIQSIRVSAEKRANDFCKRKGEDMHALSERTSTPPHILGNFPRIEILFVCKKSDVRTPVVSNKTDKYEKLKMLKSLLDDGALSTKEYNIEKGKILSR